MEKKTDSFLGSAALAGELGWLVVVFLFFGTGLGWLADTYFETPPLFFLIGSVAGITLAAIVVYRKVKTLLK